MTISAAQIRAGRGLLNWTAKDLAQKIGITPSSMSAIENGQSKGSVQTLAAIEATLISGGVDFLSSDGVTMRQTNIVEYKGAEGLAALMSQVYECARDVGGIICLHNAIPAYWTKWLGTQWLEDHKERMDKIKGKFELRITAAEGNYNLLGNHYAEYRWIPDSLFNDRAFYCYGSRLAFINFTSDDVHIYILDQQEFADGFRGMFNAMWEHVARKPEHHS